MDTNLINTKSDIQFIEYVSDSYWANRCLLILLNTLNPIDKKILEEKELMQSIIQNIIISCRIISIETSIIKENNNLTVSEPSFLSWIKNCNLAVKNSKNILLQLNIKKYYILKNTDIFKTINDSSSWWCG